MSVTSKLALLLALTAALAALVLHHATGINGPDYWRWPWRLSFGLTPYFVLLVMALPAFLTTVKPLPPVIAIGLMMTTTLGIELANRAMDLQPYELTRVATIIEEPGTTGYFTHAEEFIARGKSVRQYLGDYVNLMPSLSLHARNKPPGSILFYVPFLRLTDSENNAALAAGLFIALLATLSVPATYWLVMELVQVRAAAQAAAMCMCLTPGLVLFLPEFDQVYPAISCGLLAFWSCGLRTGKMRYAVAFGLLFALICFVTFNFLVLGVFVAGLAILHLLSPLPVLWERARVRVSSFDQNLVTQEEGPHPNLLPEYRERENCLRNVAKQAGIILLAFLGFYLLLWLWSGYNPLHTLTTAIANHQQDMPATHRTLPRTIPYDLLDFALGLGWIGALLAIYAAFNRRLEHRGLIWLALLQPVAVAISGLLQGETARVWLFMAPIALLPAGMELSLWGKRSRLAAYFCLWLLMAILSQNMVFV